MTDETTFDFDAVTWKDIISRDEINFIISEEQFKKLLHEIGDKLDKDGYIIDSKTCTREQSQDHDDIRLDELGGLLTGSKVFVKKNIASFSEHLIEKKLKT